MKRMYATLAIMMLLLTWAITGLSQKTEPNTIDPLQLREEIHKRMRDKLLLGLGPDDDLFNDMHGLFEGFDTLAPTSQNFEMSWQDSKEGRTLILAPKDEKQRLDINIENGMVSVQGKVEKKTPHGSSISSFSNSFNVPMDCDASKVQMDQKDGKIHVFFPYKKGAVVAPSPNNGRKPVTPSDDDIEI